MIEFLSSAVFVGFLAATIRLTIPILLTSLGGIISQRSGVLNLGLEGTMAVGAFAGFVGANLTGSLWIGVLTGMLAGILVSLLFAVFAVSLGANQAIVGVMIVIAAQGLVIYMNNVVFGGNYIPPKVEGLPAIRIPILADIPVIGEPFFHQNILVYCAFLLVPLLQYFLNKTTWGLYLRGVGEDPLAAETMGVNVFRTRYLATMFDGLMAGLGGAFLTIGYLGTFSDNISAGRGWIAIALVYFGQWVPSRVLLGALFFGAVNALQLRLQARGVDWPFQFMLMLPYLLTLIVLIGISRGGKGPASLCVPYQREERA
jgi:ABC-type uncharacterized transport system permease subunit